MVNVKELRIGAHVERNGQRVEVISLVVTDKDMPPIIGTTADFVGPAEVNPIPLTAALLAELGFEPVRKTLGKADEVWGMELDKSHIKVMRVYPAIPRRIWGVAVYDWDYDTLGSADVAHLHQLENIIYLCTGKELIQEEGNE